MLKVLHTHYVPRCTALCLLHDINWFQLATAVSQLNHQGLLTYNLSATVHFHN